MIRCKICGSEWPDGTNICPECSFRLAPDNKNVRYCPSCFEKISRTDESCTKCGFTLPAVVHRTENTDKYITELAAEYSEKNIIPPLKVKYLETATGRYKKELDIKDEQLKSLQQEIDELNYELIVQKSKTSENNSELIALSSELEDRERMIEMLLEEISTLSGMLNESANHNISTEEISSLQSEIARLNERATKAENSRSMSDARLYFTEGYAHIMENIVFCALLCINQIWAISYPELRWPAYMSVGISVSVFLVSAYNIARCYASHILDGVLPKIILGLLWMGLLAGTFRSGTQYLATAVLLMITGVIGLLELFVFRSRYHHLWSEYFLAMYTPTLAAACITVTSFMLCQATSVAAVFGA